MSATATATRNKMLRAALDRAWSDNTSQSVQMPSWFLRTVASDPSGQREFPVDRVPFRIGRDASANLALPCPHISKLHAELVPDGGQLIIRDLRSTNGTYLNGARLASDHPLSAGDLIQIGEIVLVAEQGGAVEWQSHTIQRPVTDSARAIAGFNKLIQSEELIVPHFQPIVRLSDKSTMAFEVLGRCLVPGLETPKAMFDAASRMHKEAELSRLLRKAGLQTGPGAADQQPLFVNVHPAELEEQDLFPSLRQLRNEFPDTQIVLEINEHSMVEIDALRRLHTELKALNIQMAYDDVGKGQSRLLELADVPPDFIKVDIDFIRNIHNAPAARQRTLAMLVGMAEAIGAVSIAEGIECEEERIACQQMGFQAAQGFLFGRPSPTQR